MKQALKKTLKAKAHHLKPVVILGAQGLTPAVQAEIDTALTAHELIKIRINAEEKAEAQRITDDITTTQGATLIQHIGKVITIYREKPTD